MKAHPPQPDTLAVDRAVSLLRTREEKNYATRGELMGDGHHSPTARETPNVAKE
jgi:hypothetical protein